MPSHVHSSALYLAGMALTMTFLAGCATQPEEAIAISKPKSLPVRTVTNFSDSLRCMDELLLAFGKRDIIITSAGIPDETGAVSAGTKDMLISTVSRLSVKSGAYRFVDFDAAQTDVHDLQNLVGFTDDFLVPNYYIRGAITQLDEGVLDEAQAASIGVSQFQVGAGTDQTVSVLTLDLNVGSLTSRQIIPGLSANNSIVVTRTGYAGDLAGEIESFGLSFNVILNKSEGLHQAVRTLIELSTIEILGKLAEVPYWRCLQIEQTNPQVIAEARGWFDDMTAKEQVVFVQRALASQGLYRGAISGQRDDATKNAISLYQADNGLIADGRVNFDLYASLINQDLAIGRQPDPTFGHGDKVQEAFRPNPLKLTLKTPQGSAEPVFRVNDTLELVASTTQDAHVYCYYADASGTVARIFPNQFQPDSYVPANFLMSIPSPEAGFDIVLDRPGANEQIVCLASTREVGLRLPAQLKAEDLVPLPVQSVDEVVQAYENLDAPDMVEARLPLRVQ